MPIHECVILKQRIWFALIREITVNCRNVEVEGQTVFLRFFLCCIFQAGLSFRWPDAAVPAIAALEKASHEAHSSDFQKYNQKMRQLTFNLKVA